MVGKNLATNRFNEESYLDLDQEVDYDTENASESLNNDSKVVLSKFYF